jgi:hypothetical protein
MQVIPEFMLKIVDIAQVRVHISHDENNGLGHFIPFFTILHAPQLVDHLLNVPSVFGKFKLLTLGIVIHNLMCGFACEK